MGRVTPGVTREDLPSLPAPLRRPAAVAVAAAALVLTVLAVRYAGNATAGRLDVRAESVVDAVAPHRFWALEVLTSLGNPLPVGVLAVLLSVVALVLKRRRLALLAIAGPVLTGLATSALKPLVGRLIQGGLAYPSGHTGAATALGLVAALLLVSVVRPGRTAGIAILMGGACLAGGVMAVTLIVRGWHYPTDTVGGFCTAVVVVLGSALLIERVAGRPSART